MSKTNYFHTKTISNGRIQIKKYHEKFFLICQTAWINFSKPAVNVAAPFLGMAVSGKTKTLKVGQATTNILQSISVGERLSLTDLHGNGLKIKIL